MGAEEMRGERKRSRGRDLAGAREDENLVYGSLVEPSADPAPDGREAARAREEVSAESR